jgi:hypothetical protein
MIFFTNMLGFRYFMFAPSSMFVFKQYDFSYILLCEVVKLIFTFFCLSYGKYFSHSKVCVVV